jgi:hypothetical protein
MRDKIAGPFGAARKTLSLVAQLAIRCPAYVECQRLESFLFMSREDVSLGLRFPQSF